MYVNKEESDRLSKLIRKLEERTGMEFVAAVVGKCDSYPEIPWKAFAMAAAVSAILLLIQTVVWPAWNDTWSIRRFFLFIFGAGAAASLLSVVWPAFGRIFLDRLRAETEIEQYARAFFLERELFRTGSRTGILLLVSLFERRVFILPDTGAAQRLDRESLQAVIDEMTPLLRRKKWFDAVARGLSALETELLRAGPGPGKKSANELNDEVVQQEGED
ncbi:MAG: TPM domain-containing protein [Spirochaetes bacterium]|nr:TPM domain-containing protein [Spirochaetota bacterium]